MIGEFFKKKVAAVDALESLEIYALIETDDESKCKAVATIWMEAVLKNTG